MNKCRNVTAKARNVDQIVACSCRARSLTLMVETSTAYPPFTGVITAPLQEFPPARCPGGLCRRNRVRHSAGLHGRWTQISRQDHLKLALRPASVNLPLKHAAVPPHRAASQRDLLF